MKQPNITPPPPHHGAPLPLAELAASRDDALALDETFWEEDSDQLSPSPHSVGRRAVALLLAGILLILTLLAAGYSLFGAPPTPERTRPLPELIPEQGAIR